MSTPVAAMHGLGEPSRWVRHWAHLVAAGGAVLDVASGAGRHARFFAALGHPVTAVDRDAAALDTLRDAPLVTPLAADLEGAAWPLPGDAKFAAVVVTNYLHRALFPQLLDALAPGGVLVYETFAQGNESVGKPSNPAFLLAPGELLDVVRGRLRVVAFQDGFLAQPRPAYVQRICAILEAERSADPAQAAPPPCYELAG
ncbi:bifunctional 2-polyprenyl-6-hydroxyphenol methylase/3-demethylubiquinol 3-O-methyltransferase UbiG [Paraburkholderia sp. BL21I4N1]|uniref:class I SAM-dependent methyltransferase n=1 Tax=Paraburkholderia sp. BL21I4N1 TaxID=1938801 RepID=UPI000CFC2A4F|nr:class I SAM-dependent methyltransferase [Paraburkholderia sp. BL21I4N1]PQV53278.1 methyltransferase family protein [Paraburkholderia sp. BL21I4N1]